MVTSPAVPPYSSMTTAMWISLRLHLAQQLVDRLAVGHERRRAHHRLDPLGSTRRRGARRCAATRSLR